MHPLLPKANEIYPSVLNAAFEVFSTVGAGLPELYYHLCLLHELRLRGFEAKHEVQVKVPYKDIDLADRLRADIVVDDCLVIELKSVGNAIAPAYIAQTLTYMSSLGCPLGLIFNYGGTGSDRFRLLYLEGAAVGFDGTLNTPDPSANRRPKPMPSWPPKMHPLYPQADAVYTDVFNAANEVRQTLGTGRLEMIYHRAILHELQLRGHKVTHEIVRTWKYKDLTFSLPLTDNILVDDCLVLTPRAFAGKMYSGLIQQTLTYLKQLDCPLGMIYNFGKNVGPQCRPVILDGANFGFSEPRTSPLYGMKGFRLGTY